jgi:hypothetical protein
MGAALLALLAGAPADACAWGPRGHALVTRAAVRAAPSLPAWFRDAEAALVELSIAPDRQRALHDDFPALGARAAEHYFELDVWGAAPLPADRWAYLRELGRRRLEPDDVGCLPWALLEEYGVLVGAFRDAGAGRPGGREQALAAAGTIAHLAGDAAVPLHATRHHDGWVGDNPHGFRRRRGVHRWFESDMVTTSDPRRLAIPAAGVGASRDVRAELVAVLRESLAAVPAVYEAELRAQRERDPEPGRALARRRAAAGATLLAGVWQAAWEASRR